MAAKCDDIIKDLLKMKGVDQLWDTQTKVIEAGLLENNENFVVVAPTASGKTMVAELAILKMLRDGRQVLYLVPMRALVSDKVREFQYLKQEGYNIVETLGARTDDRSKASVVVATFENFYKNALMRKHLVSDFGLVVIDEFHVLYDPLRGFNLEKAITILKEFDSRIICLSATFEDKKEIGEWLNAKVVDLPDECRKVPLKHGVIDLSKFPRNKQPQKLGEILLEKAEHPYILFCSTREYTISRATELSERLKPTHSSRLYLGKFRSLLGRENPTKLESQLLACLVKRVAFHHSGLDSKLRNFVEELFLKKNIDYLFTTTGLAYGINFPAKTVVLSDTTFFDPNKGSTDIPVYMYIQMAGRAGRPQFGGVGYAYIVAKTTHEVGKAQQYLDGKIEKASSHISRDEYFRKAILELIYSDRCTDNQILKFFKNTFYNFQSERVTQPFIPFNLYDAIKKHVEYLHESGFITSLGAPGYKLTDLGQVTLDFLFKTYAAYELTPFLEINKYLEEKREVVAEFDIIYKMSCLYDGACLTKIRRETSQEVEKYFEPRGVTDPKHPEYSAYAIFSGWIENVENDQIEEKFKVYASQISEVAEELYRLLNVYEILAKKKNFDIAPQFNVLKERVRYGVREDELPFIKLRRFGRATVRELYQHCNKFFKAPPYNYVGTTSKVLKALLEDVGEKEFLKIIKYIPRIGEVKAEKILALVKTQGQV